MSASLPEWPAKKPDFESPPVSEVAISVQFEPIQGLNPFHIGRLWEESYRKQYPSAEQKAPLPYVIEKFGKPEKGETGISILQGVPPVRHWFYNKKGTELIQIQNDKFVFNWRQTKKREKYPRYEDVIKKYKRHLKKFIAFLKANEIGELVPNQCEVTYVNAVGRETGASSHAKVADFIAPWSGRTSDDFLGQPEEVDIRTSYLMCGEDQVPLGRLHISLEPRSLVETDEPYYRFVLSARGAPLEPTIKAVGDFSDFARQYVIRAFASFTSKKAHKVWRRIDDT
ncbi:TIGR04255 family protein [Magnetovibrio sp. PR-2]|uniref:TIGR04255 family protein n=1 Tax=Magnetovibrio sp. PR-2 TaxID=3120356 RepID=UPI002FCE0E3E